MRPTDRQTDHSTCEICSHSPHLALALAMRANDNNNDTKKYKIKIQGLPGVFENFVAIYNIWLYVFVVFLFNLLYS